MTAAKLRSLTANHGTLAASPVRFVQRVAGVEVELEFIEARVEAEYDAANKVASLVAGSMPVLVIVLEKK